MMIDATPETRTFKARLRTANMILPTYGRAEIDFVISDGLGASVIWVKDTFLYDFHGSPSLSFVLATSNDDRRYTARISDRFTRMDRQQSPVLLYQTEMRIICGGIARNLPMMLCESRISDAPAVLTPAHYMQFILQ